MLPALFPSMSSNFIHILEGNPSSESVFLVMNSFFRDKLAVFKRKFLQRPYTDVINFFIFLFMLIGESNNGYPKW